jgi:hypothetical protein
LDLGHLLTSAPPKRKTSNYDLPFTPRYQASSGGEELGSVFNFPDELQSRPAKKQNLDMSYQPSFMEAWESEINDDFHGDDASDMPLDLGELFNVDKNVLNKILMDENWNKLNLEVLGSKD